MEGLGLFIMLCYLVTFGPPVLFLIIGLATRSRNKNTAKIFFILATVWFVIGGGTCASIMTQ
jgi:hypothetical protein